jgi:hypothetical protein
VDPLVAIVSAPLGLVGVAAAAMTIGALAMRRTRR